MKILCLHVCVGVLVGLLGCEQQSSGDSQMRGILLVQTVELREKLDKDGKPVGVCESGTVARRLEIDVLEQKTWYKIDCGGTIGWFEFFHNNAVEGPLGDLKKSKDHLMKKYSSH